MASKSNSRSFGKNLLVIIFIYSAIIWVVLRLVNNYTQHGVTITVPSLIGKTPEEIKNMESNYDLEFVITDSTYNAEKKKGTVVEQNPEPNAIVKQSRKVYITINAFKPPMAKMPKLIDMSLRQATAVLETFGLKVGNLKYEPDFAKDAVLKQLYKGKEIQAGEAIMQESKVDLVLGDGLKSDKISIPNLIGLTLAEATQKINDNNFNIGSILFEKTVKDSTKAMVFKQFPLFRTSEKVNAGRSFDLFFTQDANKVKAAKDSTDNATNDED